MAFRLERGKAKESGQVVPWHARQLVLVSDVVEKNIDSLAKSKPLRRRRENYDVST